MDERVVYKRERLALEAFRYFKSLRDKTLIHDENGYTKTMPCAALNAGNKKYKIEKILALNVKAVTLGQENYSNLKLLIDDALNYVVTKFDELCVLITEDLEKRSYEILISNPPVTYRAPTADEVHIRRNDPW